MDCNHCGKHFKKKLSLKYHIDGKHSKTSKFTTRAQIEKRIKQSWIFVGVQAVSLMLLFGIGYLAPVNVVVSIVSIAIILLVGSLIFISKLNFRIIMAQMAQKSKVDTAWEGEYHAENVASFSYMGLMPFVLYVKPAFKLFKGILPAVNEENYGHKSSHYYEQKGFVGLKPLATSMTLLIVSQITAFLVATVMVLGTL